MILKPFKVHSPDGKKFYEGDATQSPIGEDAANGAIGERPIDEEDAFQEWWETRKGQEANAYHGWMARAALTAEKVAAEPVGYVNGDELDNMLDDRTATIQASPNGWRKTPLYRSPQQPAQSAEQDERDALKHDIERHIANHSADLAAAGKEAVAIAISTEKICEIAGKYDLGNPRLDALRGFVNEIIIVNGAEYDKSE